MNDDLPNRIARLRLGLIAIKGLQFVSANDFEIQVSTLERSYSIPGNTAIGVDVRFTANIQKNPLAELNYDGNDYIGVTPGVSAVGSKVVNFRAIITNNTSSAQTRVIKWYVLSTDVGVVS